MTYTSNRLDEYISYTNNYCFLYFVVVYILSNTNWSRANNDRLPFAY